MPSTDPNEPRLAQGFDPFNDRPSRIVRNTLTKMLVDCFDRREVFPEDPPELLQQYFQAPYIDYIQGRAALFRKVTREAATGSESTLARVTLLWRHGLYFEAHEILEPLWRAASGAEREGLQGLIQAAGACVHREAGNDAAAANLARKAIDRLNRFGDAIAERQVMDIKALMEQLRRLPGPSDDAGPDSTGRPGEGPLLMGVKGRPSQP